MIEALFLVFQRDNRLNASPMESANGKREKKTVFCTICGDETITFYDRACTSDVTGGIPSGVPRHGVFHASHGLFGAGCVCSASRYGILPWRRVNMASGASSVFTALVIASGFRNQPWQNSFPGNGIFQNFLGAEQRFVE